MSVRQNWLDHLKIVAACLPCHYHLFRCVTSQSSYSSQDYCYNRHHYDDRGESRAQCWAVVSVTIEMVAAAIAMFEALELDDVVAVADGDLWQV